MPKSLSQLVTSRICHDLVSPFGAIGNGLELLTLAGSSASEELALIDSSVRNASAKLQFIRIAYGTADENSSIKRSDLTEILEGLSTLGRNEYEWTGDAELPKSQAQLVFLLIQCIESVLPRGGRIQIKQSAGGWTVTGSGQRIVPEDAHWQALQEGEQPSIQGSSQVHFVLLRNAVREQNRQLRYVLNDEAFVVEV